jgi:hypothetical protein
LYPTLGPAVGLVVMVNNVNMVGLHVGFIIGLPEGLVAGIVSLSIRKVEFGLIVGNVAISKCVVLE